MFDTTIIFKALGLVLGGGTVAAVWKFATRWLELRYEERKDLRAAELAARAESLSGDRQKRIYGDLIERLEHEISRLNADADVADRRQANNLSLFKDFAEKTAEEVSKCHDERRADREEYRRRLIRERRRRRDLERRVAQLEARAGGS